MIIVVAVREIDTQNFNWEIFNFQRKLYEEKLARDIYLKINGKNLITVIPTILLSSKPR